MYFLYKRKYFCFRYLKKILLINIQHLKRNGFVTLILLYFSFFFICIKRCNVFPQKGWSRHISPLYMIFLYVEMSKICRLWLFTYAVLKLVTIGTRFKIIYIASHHCDCDRYKMPLLLMSSLTLGTLSRLNT